MNRVLLLVLTTCLLLAGCTQGNSGDEAATASADAPSGINRFLLFPNPIVDTAGNFQTDTDAYAQAYYASVDPNGERTTLDSWKSKNQFGQGGSEFVAVFRDVRDLGYGRRMTGRRNADGSIAFYVENYNVANAPGGYSQVNVDAAVARDSKWHVGTNAIEWSPAQCTAADPSNCDATVKYTKYFNFDPSSGQRQTMLNLDGRGPKAMPGICVNCHGGRLDPLTPQSTFALVENAASRKRGDVQARLQGFNVDSFEWSTFAGFRRADQEAVLKAFNQWVLCSYPGGGTVSGTWGSCTRPSAGSNDWQGAAAPMIQSWYGGAAMANAQFSDTYLPAGWTGNASLYQQVVVPYCRTCHLLRGTANQSDIDFDSESKFSGYGARIKAHVFDRGNMPLAFLVYQGFWKSNAPSILASYINSLAISGLTATDAGGAPLRAGRPVANPGPDRMVRTGANAKLYGGDSLFASSYSWTLDSATPGATISNPNSPTATFFSNFAGAYTVHLTVSNRGVSDSKAVTITVDNNFHDPATIKFAHVKSLLQSASATCTTCHLVRAVPQPAATPPIWYTDFDRNSSGGAPDATDDAWLYEEIMGRVNLTELAASPLLGKPAGNHHNGATLFNLSANAGLTSYSMLYNWILNGAPAGGVAASITANAAPAVSFVGSPPTATIPLSGTGSIGATTYAWTIAPTPVPPAGASLSTPNASTAVLNVQNVGTYVVQLLVGNGTESDTATQQIVVTETPLAFSLTVAGLSAGSVAVPFSGVGPTGTISVTTSQSTGSPLSCNWQVLPPSSGVTVGANSCAGATLNVTTAAIGNNYTLELTEQNVSQPPVTASQSFVVTAAAGSSPSGANFTPTSAAIGFTINNNPGSTPTATSASRLLTGSATGPGTLTYAWSATAGSAGCSIPGGASTSTTRTLSYSGVGTCSVTLTVSNGIPPDATVNHTVTIASTVVLSDVATLLNSGAGCTSCHNGTTATPSWINDSGLKSRLLSTINLGAPQSSLLLVCPHDASAPACSGMSAPQPGFGAGDFTNYDAILTWIINGTP
ncbi:MAG TPA: hypothetical protein VHB46_02830 [Burkholderiales bacterium]|nr:hypothetical protein [Burkholderiales bacterium]